MLTPEQQDRERRIVQLEDSIDSVADKSEVQQLIDLRSRIVNDYGVWNNRGTATFLGFFVIMLFSVILTVFLSSVPK